MNLAGCDVLELKLRGRFYFKITNNQKNRCVKKAHQVIASWRGNSRLSPVFDYGSRTFLLLPSLITNN